MALFGKYRKYRYFPVKELGVDSGDALLEEISRVLRTLPKFINKEGGNYVAVRKKI